MPVKILFPLHLTTHFLLSNLTVHPAAVRTQIPNKDAIDNSRTICPTSVVGSPGIIMTHICVDVTRRPSANATFSGHVVFCLLWTGIPSLTKIWVAPESAIASVDAIVIAAYAHFEACRGANEENADCRFVVGCVLVRIGAYMYASDFSDSRLVVNPFETIEVTTVMSLSSTINSWAGENIWVGSNSTLITENVSLHLNTMLLLIAPNRHICGKTVLWRFLVAQLYPWSMYCCAFCLVNWMSWSGFHIW